MAPEQVLKRRAILAIQQAQILQEQLELLKPPEGESNDELGAPSPAPAAAPSVRRGAPEPEPPRLGAVDVETKFE